MGKEAAGRNGANLDIYYLPTAQKRASTCVDVFLLEDIKRNDENYAMDEISITPIKETPV